MQAPANRLLERLVLEHDPHEARELSFDLKDGSRLVFQVTTVSHEERVRIEGETGTKFPAPPIVYSEAPTGSFVRYNLEDDGYLQQIHDWQSHVGRLFLSSALALPYDECVWIENNFPYNWFNELKSTVELLNGVHSAPLQDLLEDAMWSQEVATWISTYKSPPNACTISDTALFREMECMVAAGMNIRTWKELTPREKITYMEWYTYKQAREGYQNWYTFDREKEQQDSGRRRRG